MESERKHLLEDSLPQKSRGNSDEKIPEAKTSQHTPRRITVEPVAMMYFLYLTPGILMGEQYIFKITSEKYNYSDAGGNLSSCNSAADNYTMGMLQLQQRVQRESSYIMLLLDVTSVFPSLFSTLWIGSYSDVKGRKIALVLPLIGAVLKCGISMVVIYWNFHYAYLAIGTALEGFFGLTPTLVTGVYAYIADISGLESRSIKVAIIAVCSGLAMSVSQLVSGFMIKAIGYLYSNAVLIGLTILNFLYVILIVPKTEIKEQNNTKPTGFQHIAKCIKLYTQDNGTNRRIKLCLNLLLLLITGMVTFAGMDTQTYILKGKPLCFGPVAVGLYAGGASLAYNLGTLVGAHFIGTRVGDLWIMLLSCVSGIAGATIFMLIETLWQLILIPIIGIFGFLISPMARAVASKLVNINEQGSLFAGLACVEGVSYILGILLLNNLYPATLHILPGFVYIAVVVVYLIGLLLVRQAL